MNIKTHFFGFVLLILTACQPMPKVSAPATATIQTDAGAQICEYVTVEVQGKTAEMGVCAKDDESLRTAIAIVKTAFPLVKEYVQP